MMNVLPSPSINNLDDISLIIVDKKVRGMKNNNIQTKKQKLSNLILKNNAAWLQELKNLFILCEAQSLPRNFMSKFYFIFKSILEFNDEKILYRLIIEEFYETFFGALEYNPSFQQDKFNYRKDLCDNEKYQNPISTTDEALLIRVQLCYRLTYLKESVVNNKFEDQTTNFINQQCFLKNMDLLNEIVRDSDYYDELLTVPDFSEDQSADVSTEVMRESERKLNFFLESMSVLKNLQIISIRNEFLRKMNKGEKMFQLVTNCLSFPAQKYRNFMLAIPMDSQRTREVAKLQQTFEQRYIMCEQEDKVWSNALEILWVLVSSDPNYIQRYVLNEFMASPTEGLLEKFGFILFHTRSEGLKLQIQGFIELIIVPQIPTVHSERISYFVFRHLVDRQMMIYLSQPPEIIRMHESDFYLTSSIIVNLARISLTHKIKKGQAEMLEDSEMIPTICQLFSSAPKYFKIEIIKLLSDFINFKVEIINEVISDTDIIPLLIRTLRENIVKKNMLFSSVWAFIKRIEHKKSEKLYLDIINWFSKEDENDAMLKKVLDPIRKLIVKKHNSEDSMVQVKNNYDAESNGSMTPSDEELDNLAMSLIEKQNGSLKQQIMDEEFDESNDKTNESGSNEADFDDFHQMYARQNFVDINKQKNSNTIIIKLPDWENQNPVEESKICEIQPPHKRISVIDATIPHHMDENITFSNENYKNNDAILEADTDEARTQPDEDSEEYHFHGILRSLLDKAVSPIVNPYKLPDQMDTGIRKQEIKDYSDPEIKFHPVMQEPLEEESNPMTRMSLEFNHEPQRMNMGVRDGDEDYIDMNQVRNEKTQFLLNCPPQLQ